MCPDDNFFAVYADSLQRDTFIERDTVHLKRPPQKKCEELLIKFSVIDSDYSSLNSEINSCFVET